MRAASTTVLMIDFFLGLFILLFSFSIRFCAKLRHFCLPHADSERKTTKTITYTLPIEPKERPYPSGIISLEYGLKPND